MIGPAEALALKMLPGIGEMYFGVMMIFTPIPPPMAWIDNARPYETLQECVDEIHGLYYEYFLEPATATGNWDGLPILHLPHEVRCRTFTEWRKESYTRAHMIPLMIDIYNYWADRQKESSSIQTQKSYLRGAGLPR